MVKILYETTLDSALTANTFRLEVRYLSDAEGMCAGLQVSLDDDVPQAAAWTNGTWRTNGVLGERSVAITLRGSRRRSRFATSAYGELARSLVEAIADTAPNAEGEPQGVSFMLRTRF